jgi:hypothetical protein
MPLSTDEFIETIENNQFTVVFPYKNHLTEQFIRNGTGKLERLSRALDKYPPLYQDNLPKDTIIVGLHLRSYDYYLCCLILICILTGPTVYDMIGHEQLTKHQQSFFTLDSEAEDMINVAAPACKDLFMTFIDGINIYTTKS